MKITTLPLLFLLAMVCFACGEADIEASSGDNSNVFSNPDYEDGGSDGDLDWEDQAARSAFTDATSNPVTDPSKSGNNDFIEIKYTDNEYEPAFSTATTNPKNQIAGGITPRDN